MQKKTTLLTKLINELKSLTVKVLFLVFYFDSVFCPPSGANLRLEFASAELMSAGRKIDMEYPNSGCILHYDHL